jgi:hypothetical protein
MKHPNCNNCRDKSFSKMVRIHVSSKKPIGWICPHCRNIVLD